MTVSEIISAIEAEAPLALQESWDNSGLQVGHPYDKVKGVLVCVDVTPKVIDEAVSLGANMIVSHHPLIFKGLKAVTGSNVAEWNVEKLILNRIAVYSAHTSLDNAEKGVSYMIARKIADAMEGMSMREFEYEGASEVSLRVVGPLVPDACDSHTGTGVICELSDSTIPPIFARVLKDALGCSVIRHSTWNDGPEYIRRFAICGGAGGSFIPTVLEQRMDAYVTGDLRHHDFVDYGKYVNLFDCGHYETETVARECLAEIIRTRFPELKIYISNTEQNPVYYN